GGIKALTAGAQSALKDHAIADDGTARITYDETAQRGQQAIDANRAALNQLAPLERLPQLAPLLDPVERELSRESQDVAADLMDLDRQATAAAAAEKNA